MLDPFSPGTDTSVFKVFERKKKKKTSLNTAIAVK